MADEPLLSQDEVGALLGGVEGGAIAAGQGIRARGEVCEFEIGTSNNVSSYCPAALVNLFEKTAEDLGLSLKNLLMRKLPVSLSSLRRHSYDDYISDLPIPTCLFPVTEESLPGTGLVALEATLVATFLEQYFGGYGAAQGEREPGLSSLEKRLAGLLAQALTDRLNASLARIGRLAFHLGGIETEPSRLAIAAQSEPMLVARLELVLGDFTGECHVVLPLSMLAPLRPQFDALGQGSLGEQRRFRLVLRQQLAAVQVDLSGTFCELPLSLRQLLKLSPGDVIPIRLPEQMRLRVAGTELITGQFGKSHGRRAVRVVKTLPAEHDNHHQQGVSP